MKRRKETGTSSPERRIDSTRLQNLRVVAIIGAMLFVVTALHLYTDTIAQNVTLHLLYRRLYYVPILYAAFVFGKRGGILTAIAAAVPFALHAQMAMGGVVGTGADNGLEIIMYIVVGALFGALRDMEEAKTRDLRQVSERLEDAYRKLEERAIQLINIQDYTQSILRSITSAVLTVSPDGSVATANAAAERMLGLSEYEMVPKPIRQIVAKDGGLEADTRRILSGRVPLLLRETAIETRGGRELVVQASISRMRAVGGRTFGAVVTLEDVSEVKSLTEQLIRADRLAAMGELTAGVAHEVRNPLGIIRASVQLIEESDVGEQRVTEATDIIKQEIDRLDKVIKALLDFGRPSKPTFVRVDVEEVLRDVVLFTKRFAKQADVHIVEELTGDLPPVLADPDQLKQVFLNLVTNAVQVMEETGGAITLSTSHDEDYVHVTVSDTGPGIAAGVKGKVFDPFYSTRAEGTGLGLTIVHRIVDAHDGHIEVESGPDGTKFRVSLPALSESVEEEEIA
ncbi:MAG: ATP-binding protein [Coriobacteriia bacterium]|nr:ATP-binding protein [Coriobacteriia bacterium]